MLPLYSFLSSVTLGAMRRFIVVLFHLLLFVVPFVFSPLTDELFEFNKMVAVYVFTLMIGAAWAWRMLSEKRVIFRPTPLLWPLLLWLSSHIFSTVLSIDPHTSLYGYYSRFHGGIFSTLSYLVLYFAGAANLKRDDIVPLVRTTVIAAIGVCLYAIPEHFGVSPSCVLLAKQWGVGCWSNETNPQARIFGTFGQPNWLAAYLVMMLPLVLWLALPSITALIRRQKKVDQTQHQLLLAGYVLTAIMVVAALLYTRSRSGFLALGAELALMVAGSFWLWWQQRVAARSWLISVVGFSLLAGIMMVLIGTPFTPSAGELLARFQPQPTITEAPTPTPTPETPAPAPTGTVLERGGTNSGEIRKIVWKGAVEIWKRFPIFGSGLETFAYSYYNVRPIEHNFVSEWDFLYNRAHNEFLNVLATSGLYGILTYLLLLVAIVWQGVQWVWQRGKKYATESVALQTALASGVIALAITNFFGFSTVMVAVLSVVFPLWSVLESEPETLDTAPAVTKTTQTTKKQSGEVEFDLDRWMIGKLALLLFTAWLLLAVMYYWNNDRLMARAKALLGAGYGLEAQRLLTLITSRSPGQYIFWEEKASTESRLAVALQGQDATRSAQYAQLASIAADTAVRLNPVHLNTWKTRARTYMNLASLDGVYLDPAISSLKQATELAPTDAKIPYNLALLYEAIGDPVQARQWYERSIELRPIYEDARVSYGRFLETQQDYAGAIEQYQYYLEKLKPDDVVVREQLDALVATQSATPRP